MSMYTLLRTNSEPTSLQMEAAFQGKLDNVIICNVAVNTYISKTSIGLASSANTLVIARGYGARCRLWTRMESIWSVARRHCRQTCEVVCGQSRESAYWHHRRRLFHKTDRNSCASTKSPSMTFDVLCDQQLRAVLSIHRRRSFYARWSMSYCRSSGWCAASDCLQANYKILRKKPLWRLVWRSLTLIRKNYGTIDLFPTCLSRPSSLN